MGSHLRPLPIKNEVAFAVTLTVWREGSRLPAILLGLVRAVFVYAQEYREEKA
jgi:hypothetical protein